MHSVLTRARQGLGDVHGRRRVPAALRVPLLRPRRARRAAADDLDERTIVFLDCGNIDRNPADALKRDDAHILNIDHHHDNTRFGTVNHVVPEASCTAEIVWDLMHALGVEPTPDDRRGALRRPGHRHRQVHVREHRPARARDGGRADRRRRRRRTTIYRRLYEGMPYAKLELLARALAHVERYDDGALTFTRLSATTSDEPAPRRATPRASSTTCARSRAPRSPRSRATARRRHAGAAQGLAARHRRRASTSRRSPAPQGGGGHRQAAGFSTELSRRRARRVPARAGRRAAARCASVRRPGDARTTVSSSTSRAGRPRTTSSRACAASCGVRKVGPRRARSTRSRPGCCSCSSGRATRAQRFLMALPKTYEAVARFGARLDHRRPRGRDHRDRASCPPAPLGCRPARSASARRPTARSGRRASGPTSARARGRRSRCPSARSTVHASSSSGARATAPRFAIDCSSGTYVRT